MEFSLIILISIILNAIVYFKIDYISKKINIFDSPDKQRKLHKGQVANIGGIIIFLNVLYTSLFYFIGLPFIIDIGYFQNNFHFISFFICLVPLFLIGVIDDKIHLSANTKLFLIFIVLVLALYIDKDLRIISLRFSFLNNEIPLNNFSVIFTIFSIFIFINALNMTDGINLLTGIYVLIVFIILAIYSKFDFLILLLVIGLLNYLILNYKNKVFLGDSGTIILSYIISYIFIKSYNYEANFFYADQIFLIMMIPGLDLLRVAISRTLTGNNPFSADRGHLHHLFSRAYNNFYALLGILSLVSIPILLDIITGYTIQIIIVTLVIYLIIVFILSKKVKK